MKNRFLAASTLAVATMCLAAGGALAQNADQETQAAPGTNAGATAPAAQDNGAAAATTPSAQNGAATAELQEVVVTAEKRETNLQETPIVIQAISGETLQAQHTSTVSDLQLNVPALSFYNPDFAQTSLDIRGVGAQVNVHYVEQGVALIRDGMLESESVGQEEAFYDIADTEVLEGPQSTLVGANTIGGVVEINSANPNFNGLNGYIEGQLGNYSDRMVQGAVNLPLSDTFAMRLAFYDQQENSFYKDIGSTNSGYFINPAGGTQLISMDGGDYPVDDPGHTDETAARLSLLWQPSDNFQVLGKAEYFTDSTGGYSLEPSPYTYTSLYAAGTGPTYTGCTKQSAGINYAGASGTQLICATPGTVSHSTYYYPGETPYVLDYYGENEEYRDTQGLYALRLNYTFSDGTVLRSQSDIHTILYPNVSETSYGPQNAGMSSGINGPDNSEKSEEIDLISPTTGPFYSKFNYLAGAYWYYRIVQLWSDSTSVTSPYQPNQLPTNLTISQSPNVLRNEAVFGQVNWQATHTLQLQVGARQSWDENYNSNFAPAAPPRGTIVPNPDGSGVYSINYPTGCTDTAAAPCYPTSYTVVSPLTSDYPGNHYNDSAPTGKIDLNWLPAPGQNFYLFYARGYKAGGPNIGSTLDYQTFKPEGLNDWELGWKGQLFDGHMLTQVGAYYYNYQHMQVAVEDTEYENDTGFDVLNTNIQSSSILYGLTVAEQARFGGLGVNVNFAYEHSKLGSLTTLNYGSLPAGWGSPTAVPQCLPEHTYATGTYCFNYTPYLTNVSGEAQPFAPTFSGNVSVDYIFHIGDGMLDPKVTYSYTDQQWSSIFEIAPYNLLDSRNLWNASIDWIMGKWDTQLYVTNLTNSVYLLSDQGGDVFYGNPRQFGIQATYKF